MENKLIVGTVVSSKTTSREELAALVAVGNERLVIVEECPTLPARPQTKQQMLDRVHLLSDEMDSNEEENRIMQDEIILLYAKIDALKA